MENANKYLSLRKLFLVATFSYGSAATAMDMGTLVKSCYGGLRAAVNKASFGLIPTGKSPKPVNARDVDARRIYSIETADSKRSSGTRPVLDTLHLGVDPVSGKPTIIRHIADDSWDKYQKLQHEATMAKLSDDPRALAKLIDEGQASPDSEIRDYATMIRTKVADKSANKEPLDETTYEAAMLQRKLNEVHSRPHLVPNQKDGKPDTIFIGTHPQDFDGAPRIIREASDSKRTPETLKSLHQGGLAKLAKNPLALLNTIYDGLKSDDLMIRIYAINLYKEITPLSFHTGTQISESMEASNRSML